MLLFPSSFAALVGVLLLPYMTSVRVAENEDGNMETPPVIAPHHGKVMQFDAAFYKADAGKLMKLSRQGVKYYGGKPISYNFTSSDFHKEFVITLSQPDGKDACSEAVFVSGEAMPGLCSTGLFSRSQLYCDSTRPKLNNYAGLEPKSDRGFGLEMEFVARVPSSELLRYFTALKKKELEHERAAAEYMRTPRGKVFAVKECAKRITSSRYHSTTKICEHDSDCSFDDYCLDCNKCKGDYYSCSDCYGQGGRYSKPKVCSRRTRCTPSSSGRTCPLSLSLWNWMTDSSVVPLSTNEARQLGASNGETYGYSFEVTSPAPPHALGGKQGFYSAVELLTVLKGMGIQAGPSQGMHVHINALNPKSPGKLLRYEGIIAVWMAYAKYQLVIDEMLSPGRIGNRYANSLYFGNCPPNNGESTCDRNPCGCNRRFFNQMHKWLQISKGGATADSLSFCNYLITIPGKRSEHPCSHKYPHQRYSQVNLVPVHKFGTIEFRGHSATYSITRVMSWTQFLVAFVEHFGRGNGARSILNDFSRSTADQDYHTLKYHQEQATFEGLFNELRGLVDPGTQNYFAARKWESGDRSCAVPRTPQVRVMKNCVPGGSKDKKFLHAKLDNRNGQELTLRIKIPGLTRQEVLYPDSKHNNEFVSVLMPEGYTWKMGVVYTYNANMNLFEAVDAKFTYNDVQLNHIKNTNVFWFTYNPATIEREFSEEALEQHHRCCCTNGNCLWYSESLLNDNHCPALMQDPSTHTMCVSTKSCNAITKLINTGCVKASHSRRRIGPTQCSLIKDTSAFSNLTRCKE